MPAGRPTDYDPKYCDEIVEFMTQGYSYASFAAHIDVCRDTLNDWAAAHPEFFLAKKKANDKRILWWERHARQKMSGESKGSDAVLIFMLKNAAPDLYGEKQVIEQNVKHEVTNVDMSKLTDDQLLALKNATITKIPS